MYCLYEIGGNGKILACWYSSVESETPNEAEQGYAWAYDASIDPSLMRSLPDDYYISGGSIVQRPLLSTGSFSWDKTYIDSDGVDEATFGDGLPLQTSVLLVSDNPKAFPITDSVVDDGDVVITCDDQAIISVKIDAFPYKAQEYTIYCNVDVIEPMVCTQMFMEDVVDEFDTLEVAQTHNEFTAIQYHNFTTITFTQTHNAFATPQVSEFTLTEIEQTYNEFTTPQISTFTPIEVVQTHNEFNGVVDDYFGVLEFDQEMLEVDDTTNSATFGVMEFITTPLFFEEEYFVPSE